MLRYLILIGALATMPLSGFAAVEKVDKNAAESTASFELSKRDGPVWVVDTSKLAPSQGPVWVVIKYKDTRSVS
jgi:hypothetical protein